MRSYLNGSCEENENIVSKIQAENNLLTIILLFDAMAAARSEVASITVAQLQAGVVNA